MKKLFFVFVFLQLCASALRAQNHDGLREIYLRLTKDDSKLDSAMEYAFKVKDAAVNEYGNKSMQYFRGINNIGYVYNAKGKNSRAKRWWLKGEKKIVKVDNATFPSTVSILYENLILTYLYFLPNRRRAEFFIDKYILAKSKLSGENSSAYLNLISEKAWEFENLFGLNAANKYYKLALNTRENIYGKFSAELVGGIDSLFRKDSVRNNSGRRLEIYKTLDTLIADTLSKSLPTAAPGYLIRQAAAKMDNTLKQSGYSRDEFISSLSSLALLYHTLLQEDDIALFCLNKALNVLDLQGKEGSKSYRKISADISKISNRTENFEQSGGLSVADTQLPNSISRGQQPTVGAGTPRLMLPIGHPQGITDASISPDANYVVSRSYNDVNAKVWGTRTGALLYNLPMENTVAIAKFSPDGKFILTASKNKGIIWNLADGEQKAIFQAPGDIVSASFSKNSRYIFIGEDERTLTIRETESGQLIKRIELGSTVTSTVEGNNSLLFVHTRDSAGLSSLFGYDYLTGKKKVLVERRIFTSAFSRNNFVLLFKDEAILYDIKSLKVANIFSIPDTGITAYDLTDSGDKLLVAFSDTTSTLFDTATGEALSSLPDVDLIENIEFVNEDRSYIMYDISKMADLWKTSSAEHLYAFEGDSLSLLNRNVEPFINFSTDRKYVLMVFSDNILRMWDISGPRPVQIQQFAGKSRAILTSALSSDSKYIAVSDTDGKIKIIDLSNGSSLATLEHFSFYGGPTNMTFSHNMKYLISSSDTTIRVWELFSWKLFKEIKHPGIRSFDLSADDKYLVVTSLDDSLNSVKIWDWEQEKIVKSIQIDSVIDARYNLPNNKLLLTKWNGNISMYDLNTNQFTYEKTIPGWSYGTGFSSDDRYLVNVNNESVVLLNPSDGQLINRFPVANSTGTAGYSITNDGMRLLTGSMYGSLDIWDINSGKHISNTKAHTSGFTPHLANKDSTLITWSEDGSFKRWNFNSLAPIYQVIALGPSDQLLYTPDGYYMATPNASKYLHYVTGDLNIITFDQLDVKYNRPDKVLSEIGNRDTTLISSYAKAYQKRIKKLGIDTTSFRSGYSVPEAHITNRNQIENKQNKQQLTLTISGKDSIYTLDRFNVWVNETPIFGMRGLSLRQKNRNSIDTAITVTLSDGSNRIETSISNINGTESYRLPLYVSYLPKKPAVEKLHFIGIGINEFAEQGHNLKWSVKDIRDQAKALKEKYGNNVSIDTLFDKQVSVSNITALKRKLENSRVNDKVILAYSGHGLLSKDYDYYLSTYNVNFEKPEENGLPYDVLENLLDGIPARKKLMLIDACHSGEVDKEELAKLVGARQGLDSAGVTGGRGNTLLNTGKQKVGMKNSFELMQQLFANVGRSTGATVISAAAGTQFALEKNDLENGVFSYSILEYMKTHPHAKVSELKEYVNKRVVELTAGMQVPTTRSETNAIDWEVW